MQDSILIKMKVLFLWIESLKKLRYKITGYLGEVESFFTEPVYCYFQLNSPDVSVDIIEYGIQSNIQLQYEFMDGVEVLRINDLDTLTQYIFNDGSEIFYLVDSLQYDYNSPLDSFAAVLHPYLARYSIGVCKLSPEDRP